MLENRLPTGPDHRTTKSNIVDYLNSFGAGLVQILTAIFLPADAQQVEKDRFTLELAQHFTMYPEGRAAEYLNFFMSGEGALSGKRFETAQLLMEDAGVSQRVRSEVARRAMGIKTMREKDEDSRICLDEKAQRSRKLITVFQKNFANKDWQYALGSFDFDWDVISQTSHSLSVRLWGTNTYRWHPDDNRMSTFVHKAGERLVTAGRAVNFNIMAVPTVISISTSDKDIRELFTLTQTNPEFSTLSLRFGSL